VKLLIVCSEPLNSRQQSSPFEKQFDSAWADRFLNHLRNSRDYCTGCGGRCVHCRDWRVQNFGENIVSVIRHPAVMPVLLDNSTSYFPHTLPAHDVLIAIQIHEEILIDLPAKSASAGGKALIAPVESPDWISHWAKNRLLAEGKSHKLEIAVPKPFCDLQKGTGTAIDQFIDHFKIGKPVIEIEILDSRIAKAIAKISAPCGNSHYVAHSLQGYPVNDKLQYEVSHYWHAFPCTASMKPDSELGDTILHRGGQIHMECFCEAVDRRCLK
jgi:hypothetical protein